MYKTEKWSRIKYNPCLPLGDNNSKITGCKKHIELSRKAAGEGIVLLKNEDKILPLKDGCRVAVFGKGQIDYVKGGGGSGDVYCEYVRNIYDGLKMKNEICMKTSMSTISKYRVDLFDKLSLYYQAYVEKMYKNDNPNGMFDEADIPDSLFEEAKEYADTAIITICRYSSEGADRRNDDSDTYFYLSQKEKAMVDKVCEGFENIIVLINSGACIDTSWFYDNEKIKAALYVWQGGMEGGLAVADVLMGDVTPSGKLVDTFSKKLEDYPSTEGFHESEDYVKYTEDIFVGYRYFETVPGMKEKVAYPFGFGLSYTEFEIKNVAATVLGDDVSVKAEVTNIGNYDGKEVVQVYYSAPRGKITKPRLELCAFKKTKLLRPGESETLIMNFNVKDMASYDDVGAVEKSAYILEKGQYRLYVGNSIRDTKEVEFDFSPKDNIITEKLTELCVPENLGKRLDENGKYIEVPDTKYTPKTFRCEYENIFRPSDEKYMLSDVAEGKITLDEFISQIDTKKLFELTGGQEERGVSNTAGMGNLDEFGIPAPMTADGPAGVRISPKTGIVTTAFPIATMLACTWNTDLVEEIGRAGALEMKENNLSMWLTPALNIHRNPLCGRNFEYYSEDPFVSGKIASAMVRGIQSENIVATPKHFACNNKETNRKESNSIVSERALREIYLKGFEICVKESEPRLIMTSYNLVNGTYPSENPELLEGILRREWGFSGLVTTDWCNKADKEKEILAGNDIRMPFVEDENREKCLKSIEEGKLRNETALCVKRLLELILWLE
ncbi:MAG: glycoside hydrolase family 3 C-terminal domain-containing protein [Clostridia bacterium]|nr:glycoside hydrolase family 3 C-terminal domain-containing protein [Clostridia bacterium]